MRAWKGNDRSVWAGVGHGALTMGRIWIGVLILTGPGIRARGETRGEGGGGGSWEGSEAGLSKGKGSETWVGREDGSRLQKPLKAREAK